MLHDALVALERRCQEEAPQLVEDVRALVTSASLLSTVSSVLEDPVVLDQVEASTWLDGPPVPREATGPVRLTERYEDLGQLAVGGMGEVRRVRDLELNRVLAMKLVRPQLLGRPDALARFVEEAQVTAQLQHPNVIAIHDTGRLPDGRIFFTMREVRGRTFHDAIREVHDEEPVAGGWTLRRLVSVLHQTSQTVAYAHRRGVVHRDLKPDNIMVGDFGEVQVMDWGLAKITGRPDLLTDPDTLDTVVTDRSQSGSSRTRVGSVAGTPAYMALEQARGEVHRIDARTDVYALGAILYEVLTGRAPYRGPTADAVWRQVLDGPPPPLDDRHPPELVEVCARAMVRNRDERLVDAETFAEELAAWLDGSRRRQQALQVVERAHRAGQEAESLRERAAAARDRARALLRDVPAWAPEEEKAAGWAIEDEAEALEEAAERKILAHHQLLNSALEVAPRLPEAHLALVRDHRAAHEMAERSEDRAGLRTAAALLEQHARALDADHPVRGEALRYLEGQGALTLVTDPPDAHVELLRYERRGRRRVPVPVRSLGPAPIRELPLPMGSYLLILRAPGCADVRYPISIGRLEHWHGVRPGDSEPHPVWLPPADLFGDDEVYVPAGWFLAGARDTHGAVAARSRLWCDSFSIRKFASTNRQYLAFLNDLVERGQDAEADRWAPRERGGTAGQAGPSIYGRDAHGRYELRPDADGDIWDPDWPVLLVDHACASAYARWEAVRTGQPWRLPWDLEYEKAARGADGRARPWGDRVDPSFCCYIDSHPGRVLPVPVHAFPLDESPYGVRGLAGCVRTWCADGWAAAPDFGDAIVRPVPVDPGAAEHARYVYRGGYWGGAERLTHAAFRTGLEGGARGSDLGIRLARSVEP